MYSPIGEVFRARLRQFPALVSCCTIDWFSEWPAEALRSVAIRFLNDIPDLDSDERTMDGLVCNYSTVVRGYQLTPCEKINAMFPFC